MSCFWNVAILEIGKVRLCRCKVDRYFLTQSVNISHYHIVSHSRPIKMRRLMKGLGQDSAMSHFDIIRAVGSKGIVCVR